MRKAETPPKKLLLLPVIPALMLGIIELATPEEIPFSAPAPVRIEKCESVSPPPVAVEQPPQKVPDQGGCDICTASL